MDKHQTSHSAYSAPSKAEPNTATSSATELRLTCLELAIRCRNPKAEPEANMVVEAAQTFYDFVTTEPKVALPVATPAPAVKAA